MDDPFMSCPYDKCHRVPRSRIQAHIIKCEKKYPKLNVCPYNATHRLPDDEIQEHLKKCPTKVELYFNKLIKVQTGALTTPKPLLQKEYLPETDPNHEMWDD